MSGDKVDALVIFGATGDLAKLETFPALVGLVERGVLDVPVVGVAKSGWSLDQFCDYAVASLKLNNMDPGTPAAKRMLDLPHYVDGDLGDPATYQAMSDTLGQSVQRVLFYLEVPPPLFARIAEGISTVGACRRAPGDGREAVRQRPCQRPQAERHDAPVLPRGRHLPGGPLAGPRPSGVADVRAVRELDHRADPQQELRAVRPDHNGRGLRRRGPRQLLRQDRCDRLPQLEVLYRPPSADTHADAVSGIATTP